MSDWLAIRPDSSPLLTPNYLTKISLTVESEIFFFVILKTYVTEWRIVFTVPREVRQKLCPSTWGYTRKE